MYRYYLLDFKKTFIKLSYKKIVVKIKDIGIYDNIYIYIYIYKWIDSFLINIKY